MSPRPCLRRRFVENTGDIELQNVQVTDGLDAVFGPGLLSVTSAVITGPCVANAAYTGSAPNADLLDGLATLPIGDSCTIAVDVTVLVDDSDPTLPNLATDYTNTADGDGVSPAGTLVAASDTALVAFAEAPAIGIAKTVASPPVNNNAGYTGSAPAADLLDGLVTLPVGESCTVEVAVTVEMGAAVTIDTPYTNAAATDGTSPSGTLVDASDTADTMFTEAPAIDTLKSVVGDPVNNGDGTHTIDYQIMVENTGDVELRNVQVTDGLEAVFGAQLVSATTTAAAPCVANAAYTGLSAGGERPGHQSGRAGRHCGRPSRRDAD